jgi:hypothetical protein
MTQDPPSIIQPMPLPQQPMSTPKKVIKPPTYAMNLNFKLMCRDCRDPIPNIVEDFSAGDLICGSCGELLLYQRNNFIFLYKIVFFKKKKIVDVYFLMD